MSACCSDSCDVRGSRRACGASEYRYLTGRSVGAFLSSAADVMCPGDGARHGAVRCRVPAPMAGVRRGGRCGFTD